MTQQSENTSEKKRAGRNRTLVLTEEQEQKYFEKCLPASEILTGKRLPEDFVDRTICAPMEDVIGWLPKKSVDLMIVDPPYNLTKKYKSRVFNAKTIPEYEAYTRKWLMLVRPLLKDTATIYVCCDWKSSLVIGRILEEYFTVRNRITWQREKGRGAKHNWKNGMEDIWFATVGEAYTFQLDAVKQRRQVIAPYREDGVPRGWKETDEGRYRDTCPSNFWDDITIPFWSMPENTEHPTQKPEKLLAKLILASSKPGDFVFDPFLGSGSTSVTAKKLGRHYLGIEREKHYCALAEARLAAAETDPVIQGYADGVFWERNTAARQISKG